MGVFATASFAAADRRCQDAPQADSQHLGAVACGDCHLPHDGEDGALHRVAHRPMGAARRLLKGGGEVQGVEAGLAGEAVGEPPQCLGEDDPRVAAGPHQRSPRHRPGDDIGGVAARLIGLVHRGPHRQVHVGAGVAVRDGEDVDGVDRLRVALQPGRSGGKHLPQVVAGVGEDLRTGRPAAGRTLGGVALGFGGSHWASCLQPSPMLRWHSNSSNNRCAP